MVGPFKCKYSRGTCALPKVSLAPSGGRRAPNLHVIASIPTARLCGNKSGLPKKMAPKTLATQGDSGIGVLFHSQRRGRGSTQDLFGAMIFPFLSFVCVCVGGG